jgi:hypothetical protein
MNVLPGTKYVHNLTKENVTPAIDNAMVYSDYSMGNQSNQACEMKTTKLMFNLLKFFSLVLVGVLFSGCAPMTKTSKYMAASVGTPAAPPAGKTLVCIHRPKNSMGWKLYTKIWCDSKFIGDLGNRHSMAYVCEPGEHYFMNTSVEETGCVEAQLLPDQTYDLWVQGGYGFWVASFKLKPVQQDDKGRQLVAKWTQQDRWVQATPTPADLLAKEDHIKSVFEEFISGRRHDKLQHLAPEDHR